MSNDIERLLADAADDSDQPMHTTVDDLLTRARRSARHRRLATAATAVLTTAVVIGGMATWSATRSQTEGPASNGQTVTIDPKTGLIVDDGTGKTVVPPPPVSPLSDAEILARCQPEDRHSVAFLHLHKANVWDKAGPIDARWKVVVKSGDQDKLIAMFLAPDKSIVATCGMAAAKKPDRYGRISTTEALDKTRGLPQAVENNLRIPVPGVTRVLVDIDGESSPRQALVGTDGFYTIGYQGTQQSEVPVRHIRGYDAGGKKVYDQLNPRPVLPTPTPVDPKITVKTADPIEPVVDVTTDPASGKPLAPTPVSPLTDDQIRDRCQQWEHEIETEPAYQGSGAKVEDPREKEAGPINSSWLVALKTGTGDKFTAVLISPDKRVAVWCHMTKATTKGGESDYTRVAVTKDGKFADGFNWAMVPDGVAQIIIDLPKQGPTKALIANGYYIWGVTGGNSDIRSVPVRGYDAQGKQVYQTTKSVDVG